MSHQPGSSPSSCLATWQSPLKAWQMRTALSARGVERPVRLVDDGQARQRSAELEPDRPRENGRLGVPERPRRPRAVAARAWSAPSSSYAPLRLPLGSLERLVEVRLDVLDVLDADRQPDVLRRHAGLRLLFRRQLRMRRRRRMNHERLGVADIGQVARKLDAVDELDRRVAPALDAEAEDGARAVGQVPPARWRSPCGS